MNEAADLNPGIRKVVAWLNARGFKTVDSGDGQTHDFECDRGYPYVVMRVEQAAFLVDDTDRLREVLEARGIHVRPIGEEVGNDVSIQATYDPASGTAIIDLMGLDDARLAGLPTGGHEFIYRAVHHRVRRAREESGMSQSEVGARLQPHRSHAAVSDIERGKTVMKVALLYQFAEIFQKDIIYFFGYER